jgi:hypothetical protein
VPNVAARKKAGTLDKPWDEKVRAKIQTSMLVNRLHDHVFATAELSQTQMKAIEILLRKSLPDLSAVTLSGAFAGISARSTNTWSAHRQASN